jgi:bifunctional DNA-binding transcriptional regulator/antitoxin component of YhaV-PrlF toxin-antitoxin module
LNPYVIIAGNLLRGPQNRPALEVVGSENFSSVGCTFRGRVERRTMAVPRLKRGVRCSPGEGARVTEKLVVDAEGKVTIPRHILERRGLRPGDELTLVEADEGLLVDQHGIDPLTARWWAGLDEGRRGPARAESECYEGLSEGERDRAWKGE